MAKVSAVVAATTEAWQVPGVSSSKDRLPQLDGLRAIAIGAVVIHHFNFASLHQFLPLWLGVQLFFVLSGFLITTILLRGTFTAGFIGTFYLRRALRLLPLYYIVLAIVAIYTPVVRTAWPYYVFYAANFWVVQAPDWASIGPVSHFWTLAVEEQFYLVWPFVVLCLARWTLPGVCVALLIIAPVFRIVTYKFLQQPLMYVLLPGSFDWLACGALLALIGAPIAGTRAAKWATALAVVAGFMAMVFFFLARLHPTTGVLVASFALPGFYLLVARAAGGIAGPFGWFLDLPPVQYLGRISYGLYVIHLPVRLALMPYLMAWTSHKVIAAAICAAISIGLAALSWHFLENPINRRRHLIAAAIFGKSSERRGIPEPLPNA